MRPDLSCTRPSTLGPRPPMRRFSQHSHLVTLSEINITPLLEKGLDVRLPKTGGQADQKISKNDIRTVEIDPKGGYSMNKRPLRLDQLIGQLVQDFKYNPNLVVYIRADGDSRTKDLAALIDGCQRNGITRYSLRTSPLDGK